MPDFRSPRMEHWDRISHKPHTFPPAPHTTNWSDIVGIPAEFSSLPHTHLWAHIIDPPATYAPSFHTHAWADITGKPLTFPPSSHTHTVSQITDFPLTWDWTKLTNVPASFPPSAHTHVIADTTGLQTALNGKSNIGHTHDWVDITGKPATFPPSSHAHVISDVTGLQTALDSKMDKPFAVNSVGSVSASYSTAYRTSSLTRPSWISAIIDVTHSVALAGTQQDVVELRVGTNQSQVAAGTGGTVAATWRAQLTAILTLVGAGVGQRGQLVALVPAGHYWALRRTTGSNATINYVTEQEVG